MRSAYKYLAFAVPVLVVCQAMFIAVGFFGLANYSEDHSLPKKPEDANLSFTGDFGLNLHGINGQMIIPLVALILLIVSFFAKIPGGSKWAAFIVVDVILQIALAFIAFGAPIIGLLHGLNAFVLAGLGIMAGRAAMASTREPVAATV